MRKRQAARCAFGRVPWPSALLVHGINPVRVLFIVGNNGETPTRASDELHVPVSEPGVVSRSFSTVGTAAALLKLVHFLRHAVRQPERVVAVAVARHRGRAAPYRVKTALKIDVEGFELDLLRELLSSGVLCERVDDLYVEWHAEDASAGPEAAARRDVLQWMLRAHNKSWRELERAWQPYGSARCRTTLLKWI